MFAFNVSRKTLPISGLLYEREDAGAGGSSSSDSSGGSGGDNRDNRGFGSIGDHQSYGMDKDSFDQTIGRDRDNDRGGDSRSSESGSNSKDSAAAKADFDSVRNAFRRTSTVSEPDSGSLTNPSEGSLASPQNERYSTPSPIGGASSYGVDASTFEAMDAPHKATAPARQESWAKDVINRGGPTSEPERQRLENLATGRTTRQAVDFASSVAGAVSPVVGLGAKLAGYIGKKLSPPEFQAGYESVDDTTVSGLAPKALGAIGALTGSQSIGQAAQLASKVSPFASAVETELSDKGDLYGQIRKAAGIESLDTSGNPRDRGDINYSQATSVEVPQKETMASRFAAPSTIQFAPTNYTNYIQDYMNKILGGGN